MIRGGITLRLLSVIAAIFFAAEVSIILLVNYQVKIIIDRSQAAVYSEKLDSILDTLSRKYDRLQLTGMAEVYEEDFKESIVRTLRQIHYKTSNQRIYPFIFGADGSIVMHPEYPYGDKSLANIEYMNRTLRLKTGDIHYTYKNRGEKWAIFKHFKEWDWIVGYTIPIDVKYAEAGKLRNNLLLTMTAITLLVLLVLSVIITRLTKPITDLTNISSEIAAGKLDHEINIRGTDEIGILAGSFDHMRVSVKNMIRDLEDKNRELSREIMERKRFEKSLKESERNYREIFNAAGDAIFIHDADTGAILDVNETMLNMYGYSYGEAVKLGASDLSSGIHPYTQEEAARRLRQSREEGPQLFEWHARRKNGELFWVEVALKGTRIGGADRVLAVVRDISKRKTAEEALNESENKFRCLAEDSLVGIYMIQDGIIEYLNPELAHIFGYEVSELAGRPVYNAFILPEDLPSVTENLRKRLSGETKSIYYEFRGLTKKGDIIHVEAFGSATSYRGKPAIIGTLLDITEHKKLEEQLRQSQKMEAVGQLAGGIAHDFNNVLTAIIGFAYLIKMKLEDSSPLVANVEHIISSANKAAYLTQSLLAFSRKQIINPKPVRINEIIHNLDKFLVRILGEDIELSTVLTGSDTTIMADSVQMDQVLMNLATNARDAMPHGGELKISTACIEMDNTFISTHGYGKVGRYVLISVSDTGTGMDNATQEKIFEPFFTTKEVGQGTGLGMSVLYGIIKQHEGFISVYSETGRGTTFTIYFPLIKAGIEKEEAEAASLRGGMETLLLAEDDEMTRKLARTILEEFGYTVIEAVNGADAINKFKANKDRIQLLVLDVIMPIRNGREVYQEVKKVNPDIKALFTSGYPHDIIHKKGILDNKLNFISKPLSPENLLEKVREILDSR